MLKNYINKENLHHSYLIKGDKDIVDELSLLLKEELGFNISNNPDFHKEIIDTFYIEDARTLKSKTFDKALSGENQKKIFVIFINNFLVEAQNSLLKVFEEPLFNTHFFIITPNISMIVPTLYSRFYVIKDFAEKEENKLILDFIKMNKKARIDFIKVFLKKEDEEGAEGSKTKVFNFLNELEGVLAKKENTDKSLFKKFFETRKTLRELGASPKMLLENIALQIKEN